MKNKFQKMNKSDLYFTVIQACKEIGLDYIDVDRKKCFVDNNSYKLISKNGNLLSSIDLDKLFKVNEEGEDQLGRFRTFFGCSLIPFIFLSFGAIYLFFNLWVYGFLGLIRNQEKRYSCLESQEYKKLNSEAEKEIFLKECISN